MRRIGHRQDDTALEVMQKPPGIASGAHGCPESPYCKPWLIKRSHFRSYALLSSTEVTLWKSRPQGAILPTTQGTWCLKGKPSRLQPGSYIYIHGVYTRYGVHNTGLAACSNVQKISACQQAAAKAAPAGPSFSISSSSNKRPAQKVCSPCLHFLLRGWCCQNLKTLRNRVFCPLLGLSQNRVPKSP